MPGQRGRRGSACGRQARGCRRRAALRPNPRRRRRPSRGVVLLGAGGGVDDDTLAGPRGADQDREALRARHSPERRLLLTLIGGPRAARQLAVAGSRARSPTSRPAGLASAWRGARSPAPGLDGERRHPPALQRQDPPVGNHPPRHLSASSGRAPRALLERDGAQPGGVEDRLVLGEPRLDAIRHRTLNGPGSGAPIRRTVSSGPNLLRGGLRPARCRSPLVVRSFDRRFSRARSRISPRSGARPYFARKRSIARTISRRREENASHSASARRRARSSCPPAGPPLDRIALLRSSWASAER